MRICWAQYGLWAAIIVLAVMSMLAGCGAKGDLYLPQEEQAAQQPAEQKAAPEGAATQPTEAQPQ